MSDEPQVNPEPAPEPPAEATPPPMPEPGPDPVPYDRFKEVNDRFKAAAAELEAIKAKQKADDEARLAEEKKWQELAERREAELKAEKTERLRLQVATAKGLPVTLAARLQGETQEELEADADKMLEYIKPAEAPGVPPAGRRQSGNNLSLENMSPEQIRQGIKEGKISF